MRRAGRERIIHIFFQQCEDDLRGEWVETRATEEELPLRCVSLLFMVRIMEEYLR